MEFQVFIVLKSCLLITGVVVNITNYNETWLHKYRSELNKTRYHLRPCLLGFLKFGHTPKFCGVIVDLCQTTCRTQPPLTARLKRFDKSHLLIENSDSNVTA